MLVAHSLNVKINGLQNEASMLVASYIIFVIDKLRVLFYNNNYNDL